MAHERKETEDIRKDAYIELLADMKKLRDKCTLQWFLPNHHW